MHQVKIMGILNVTPDSFYDGGKYTTIDGAVEHAQQMMADGAHIIDVGGESTRPGAVPVSEDEELRRVIPVVKKLQELKIPVSIDTYKPNVVKQCLDAGAVMVNDVSGLGNEMLAVVSKYNVPVVVMHQFSKKEERYNLVGEVKSYLCERIAYAHHAGVKEIIIDPGIGFGKTAEQNVELLERLLELHSLYCPVLIGPSRKTFLKNRKKLTTFQALVLGIKNGADFVRVHDVLLAKKAIRCGESKYNCDNLS